MHPASSQPAARPHLWCSKSAVRSRLARPQRRWAGCTATLIRCSSKGTSQATAQPTGPPPSSTTSTVARSRDSSACYGQSGLGAQGGVSAGAEAGRARPLAATALQWPQCPFVCAKCGVTSICRLFQLAPSAVRSSSSQRASKSAAAASLTIPPPAAAGGRAGGGPPAQRQDSLLLRDTAIRPAECLTGCRTGAHEHSAPPTPTICRHEGLPSMCGLTGESVYMCATECRGGGGVPTSSSQVWRRQGASWRQRLQGREGGEAQDFPTPYPSDSCCCCCSCGRWAGEA